MSDFCFLEEMAVSAVADSRGNLGISELGTNPKIAVHRIYYMNGVPSDAVRGSHAHKELEQIFYCLKGSFVLSVTDGVNSDTVKLQEMGSAYYIPSGLWRELSDFEADAVCLVLASRPYEESDYIFDFDDFKKWRSSK